MARRTLLVALILALTSVASATGVFAQSDLIRIGAGPDDPSAPIIYADQAGLFKKAGLNVEIDKLAGGAVVAAAVAGGSLEIGKGSTTSVVEAVGRGLPFTVIGAIANYDPQHQDVALIVMANSPIKTAKDLVGQTLADISLADQSTVGMFGWLEKRGVDYHTVKFVEVPASATLPALEQGRVVASGIYEPALSNALATGKVRVIGHPFDGISTTFTEAVTFGNTAWVQGHGDLVRRFQTVMQQAGAYVEAHESEVASMVAKFGGIDPATMPAKINHPGRRVAINAADIQPVIDALAKYQVIPKSFPASDMICSCALRH